MFAANYSFSRSQKILTIYNSISQVLPITILPISVATLIMVINFAHKKKNLTESLPFILMQLNTIFVWTCEGF